MRYVKIPVMEINAVTELFYCCYAVNSRPTIPAVFQHLYTKRPAVWEQLAKAIEKKLSLFAK